MASFTKVKEAFFLLQTHQCHTKLTRDSATHLNESADRNVDLQTHRTAKITCLNSFKDYIGMVALDGRYIHRSTLVTTHFN